MAAEVADVRTLEQEFVPAMVRRFQSELRRAPLVMLDGNLPAVVIQVCRFCTTARPLYTSDRYLESMSARCSCSYRRNYHSMIVYYHPVNIYYIY